MSLKEVLDNVHITTAEELKHLPKLSYSAMDQFNQCRYRYWLHYEEKHYPKQHAIALSLGTFLHSAMEYKGRALMANEKAPTKDEVRAKFSAEFEALQADFWEEFATPDKDGRLYSDKINTFWENYDEEMTDPLWKVVGCEKEFYFTYKGYIFHGFIDRLDQNKDGNFRVVDYKSARAPYQPKQRAYAMQMFIYALGIYAKYGQLPINFEYDFLFFNFEDGKRLMSALDREDSLEECAKAFDILLDNIENCKDTGAYVPTTSPLCFWCEFNEFNTNSTDDMKHLCDFHSMWKPDAKTFSVKEKVDKSTFTVKNKVPKNKEIIW